MFPSRFMPCPDCGASLDQDQRDEHSCELERWLDYQIFQLGEEIAALDEGLRVYLDSLRGRFELWYAQRQRESGGWGA